MRVSHKHKFVYIAIQKTGSQVIRNVLGKYSDIVSVGDINSPYYEHTSAINLKKHFTAEKFEWDSYFKFTFVRNPWDLAVSHYFYRKKLCNKIPVKNWPNWIRGFYEQQKQDPTFNSWIKSRRGILMVNPNETHFTQHDMFTDTDGNYLVDFIGKFESLQSGFDGVCKKVGLPTKKLPLVNATSHAKYTNYYDNESRGLIERVFKVDIDKFGYMFG